MSIVGQVEGAWREPNATVVMLKCDDSHIVVLLQPHFDPEMLLGTQMTFSMSLIKTQKTEVAAHITSSFDSAGVFYRQLTTWKDENRS